MEPALRTRVSRGPAFPSKEGEGETEETVQTPQLQSRPRFSQKCLESFVFGDHGNWWKQGAVFVTMETPSRGLESVHHPQNRKKTIKNQ